MATITSALIVAIPALMFYRYFRGLVASYVIEMEEQAMILLDTIDQADLAPPAPRARK